MNIRMLTTAAIAALTFPLLAGASPEPAASPGKSERITVPLSDPSKPVRLDVELMSGAVVVDAWDGKEVVIDATAGTPIERGDDGENDDDEPPPPGMKRIDNPSLGLEVEEQGNVVEISAESWRVPVDLVIKVPRRADLSISTVNGGEIKITGIEGDLELENANGGITVERSVGSVVAETVNGDIRVRLLRVTSDKPMAFSSMNGDVEVTLPAAAKANVSLRSDNGEIYSDFDVATAKASKPTEESDGKRFRVVIERTVRGTIGGGGPELRLQSVNGDLFLKKGG